MSESDEQSSNQRPWHYILLWVIALASLALNVYILVGFNNFQRNVQQEANRLSQTLDEAAVENYEVPVMVDETFAVSLTVPFSDTFEVPINTTVPVSTSITVDETISVPFNDVVSLNRDVQIYLSVLGQSIPVNVPIRADIPLDLQTEVPINLDVPVQTEIPIDLVVEVPVNMELPIEADIPVQMDFLVTVPLEEMGLNALLEQLQEGLRQLAGSEQ